MKNLKLILITLILSTFVVSCDGVINSNSELYGITDGFVESLNTTYDSYGMLGGQEHTKYTSDSVYKIFPIGRLINVRIEKTVGGDEYESLKDDLVEHYKNNVHVNKVYICKAGTIMIDCRN
jgi:hypothetical protein